ncbi:hypothetical protein TNCV_2653301 [Trichonephila clavipes]|nr:hypothetical protein TNCV_2653301 [Trichonephila clavipes]
MHRSPQWYWVRTHNMPATIRCLDHQATTATRSLLKEVENDHACTAIDADLREQILKLGPYQSEGNFQNDAKGRSFSSSYSFISKTGQKIERKWLCYSTRLHVAYCQWYWARTHDMPAMIRYLDHWATADPEPSTGQR